MSDPRVVHQIASWCLEYPDEALLDRLGTLTDAVAEQRQDEATARLAAFLEHLDRTSLPDIQQHYVDVFDMTRNHALYLSYWTDGDTRRRGEVLGAFKARYRASGFLVATGGELPDYLPMVLEYAALADAADGARLLQEYRPSLEMLRIALAERDTPYADVVVAICATLPGESPQDRAAVMRMAGAGPPSESVGLESYDPRLLPMHEEAPR